jgi:chemotaxis protein MotA
MRTLPIGLVFACVILVASMLGADFKVFINLHSFIIVVLGTIAVSLISIPFRSLVTSIKAIFDLFHKDKKDSDLKSDLLAMAKNRFNYKPKSNLPILAYASELWSKGIPKDSFDSLLKQKFEEMNAISELPVAVIKNLAKYPPALGMTGTVMGMISLFANLSSDNKSSIGQALAVAMTATFYGLVVANLLLLPLADRLNVKFIAIFNRNVTILNALIKINHDEPLQVIEESNVQQEYYEQAG